MDQTKLSDFDQKLATASAAIDWTFAGENTTYMTHGLHPYPARMIPQVARRLIISYSKEGDLIWDPFCGSGTVLVESMLLRRRSIGTDINPFATFLSRVKTQPIEPGILREAGRKALAKARSLAQSSKAHTEIPMMKNIDYWFKPYVQNDLANLRGYVETIEDSTVKDFLRLCLALTVREVSNLSPIPQKLLASKPLSLYHILFLIH
jgi:hypothetical protein